MSNYADGLAALNTSLLRCSERFGSFVDTMNQTSLPIILAIDAQDPCLDLIRAILVPDHYQVVTAASPSMALSAAKSNPIDLVLCDTHIDGCDGEDLVRKILELPERNDVPFMFMAQGQGPDLIRRKFDFGGAYLIKKPLDGKLLIDLVERALWMPALVKTHIARPHFKIGPGIAAGNAQQVMGTTHARGDG